MQLRTLENVTAEFEAERHWPMLRLIEGIKQEPWAHRLAFDSSMLRLWVARKNATGVEIMITYGDGRHGGRPTNLELDSFEFAARSGDHFDASSNVDAKTAVERIRSWLESQENKSTS